MVLYVLFLVSLLLAAVSALPAAEPYGRYGFLFLVVAVACVGFRVFGIHT